MKRLIVVAVAAVCAIVAVPASASAACPPGHSQMGCSLPPVLKGISTPPKGEIVPDVSSYQRTVNWSAVKTWQLAHGWKLPGGIFKLGENVADPYAVQNGTALRTNHMAAIGYVFVRPGLHASTAIGWAHAARIKVVVLDEEVPGIQGTAARITPALKAAGLIVVDYHSQSNVLDWTARGLPCWDAAYGLRWIPVCTTGGTIAWQFTDIGLVPGISGLVDESISIGLLKLAEPAKPAPKPKPRKTVCFGKHATPASKSCLPVIRHHNWLVARRDYWHRQYLKERCPRLSKAARDHNVRGCGTSLYWWTLRRGQAVKLNKRYSA